MGINVSGSQLFYVPEGGPRRRKQRKSAFDTATVERRHFEWSANLLKSVFLQTETNIKHYPRTEALSGLRGRAHKKVQHNHHALEALACPYACFCITTFIEVYFVCPENQYETNVTVLRPGITFFLCFVTFYSNQLQLDRQQRWASDNGVRLDKGFLRIQVLPQLSTFFVFYVEKCLHPDSGVRFLYHGNDRVFAEEKKGVARRGRWHRRRGALRGGVISARASIFKSRGSHQA